MLTSFLLMLAGDENGIGAGPSVTGLSVVSTTGGSCGTGASAALRAAWTLNNGNPALYTMRLYENGVLVRSDAYATTYDKTISGYVEFGPGAQYVSYLVYRVDLVRTSDNLVMSTTSGAPWQQTYGTCDGDPS